MLKSNQVAEESSLALALTDRSNFDVLNLRHWMFFDPKIAAVWKELERRADAGRDFDVVSIAADIEGVEPSYLSRLLVEQSSLITPAEVSGVVRDEFVARQIQMLPVELEELEPVEQLRRVTERLERIELSLGKKLPTLAEVTRTEVAHILRGEQQCGLPCGLGIERVVPGGLPTDKVTILFGESGNFKTTVKNAMMFNLAAAGYTVLDAGLEDSNELTSQRYLSRKTSIPYGEFSAADNIDAKRTAQLNAFEPEELASRIILGGELSPNIDEIIRLARYYKRECGLHAVFIDYIQLLEGPARRDERTQLTHVMRRCQNAAKRDKIAYILVSQINQKVDYRDDKRPLENDLFGSSTIKQFAKLILGVYRPSKYSYEPERSSRHYLDQRYYELHASDPAFADEYARLLELHVLKNVVGETAIVHADVDAPTGVVTESGIRGRL